MEKKERIWPESETKGHQDLPSEEIAGRWHLKVVLNLKFESHVKFDIWKWNLKLDIDGDGTDLSGINCPVKVPQQEEEDDFSDISGVQRICKISHFWSSYWDIFRSVVNK